MKTRMHGRETVNISNVRSDFILDFNLFRILNESQDHVLAMLYYQRVRQVHFDTDDPAHVQTTHKMDMNECATTTKLQPVCS